MQFEVGEWVYLKLQLYKQLSTKPVKDNKLSKRYYETYKILERIEPVAYKLAITNHLPPSWITAQSLSHRLF